MSEQLAPTRTPAFEARLKKRYAAERRFKLAGLSAIVFSVGVLAFLLITMSINGIGGFQRAEMNVPIDFTEAGISGDASTLSQIGAVQTLEAQGLPAIVQYFAGQQLGEEGAAEISDSAWRLVADKIIADPAILREEVTFSLPASPDLAAGLAGEGSPEMRALADGLAAEGKLAT